jgi:hypothetical protein
LTAHRAGHRDSAKPSGVALIAPLLAAANVGVLHSGRRYETAPGGGALLPTIAALSA